MKEDKESTPTDENSGGWKVVTKDQELDLPSDEMDFSAKKPKIEAFHWKIAEFVAHEKTTSWYLKLAGATLLLAAVVYLLTRDKITTGTVIFVAVILGFYASRKPRQLTYSLNEDGLTIGSKLYRYELFKSFSVTDEDNLSGLMLTPLKRFMPLLTVYYFPKDEKKVLSILGERLPMDNRDRDSFERFLKRIKF